MNDTEKPGSASTASLPSYIKPAVIFLVVILLFASFQYLRNVDILRLFRDGFAMVGDYRFIDEFKTGETGIFVSKLEGDKDGHYTEELVEKLNVLKNGNKETRDAVKIRMLPIVIKSTKTAIDIGNKKNAFLVIIGKVVVGKDKDTAVFTDGSIVIIKSNPLIKKGEALRITEPERMALPDEKIGEPDVLADFVMGYYFYKKNYEQKIDLLKETVSYFERMDDKIREMEKEGELKDFALVADIELIAGTVFSQYSRTHERIKYIGKAIRCYENGVKFKKREKYPDVYAGI